METWLDNNGTETQVGSLTKDPGEEARNWEMSSKPYVFLSHTGTDGVKEEIVRPTHWFLTEVLHIKCYFDSMSTPGDEILEALLAPAYECTHALVILSQNFRRRKYCVKELNTFMDRLRRADKTCHHAFHVIPALWRIENIDDYAHDVQKLVWIGDQTGYVVDYMVQTLWPELCRRFGFDQLSRNDLKENLAKYVHHRRGEGVEIPNVLESFVKNFSSSHASFEASPTFGPSSHMQNLDSAHPILISEASELMEKAIELKTQQKNHMLGLCAAPPNIELLFRPSGTSSRETLSHMKTRCTELDGYVPCWAEIFGYTSSSAGRVRCTLELDVAAISDMLTTVGANEFKMAAYGTRTGNVALLTGRSVLTPQDQLITNGRWTEFGRTGQLVTSYDTELLFNLRVARETGVCECFARIPGCKPRFSFPDPNLTLSSQGHTNVYWMDRTSWNVVGEEEVPTLLTEGLLTLKGGEEAPTDG